MRKDDFGLMCESVTLIDRLNPNFEDSSQFGLGVDNFG